MQSCLSRLLDQAERLEIQFETIPGYPPVPEQLHTLKHFLTLNTQSRLAPAWSSALEIREGYT